MALRRLSTSTLFLMLMVMLAVIPTLYLMQWIYNNTRPRQGVIVADLQVFLNSSDPHHLVVPLLQDPASHEVTLHGSGMLKSGVFPWPEAPFEAMVVFGMSPVTSVPVTLHTDTDFIAWYRENYLGEVGVTQKVPCEGWLKISRSEFNGILIKEIEGTLELTCTGFGRDLRWHTPDDVKWLIQGTISRRWLSPD